MNPFSLICKKVMFHFSFQTNPRNPTVIRSLSDMMVVSGVRACVQGYFHRPPLSTKLRHTAKKQPN